MARFEPFGTEATSQTPDPVAYLDPGAGEPLGSLAISSAQVPTPRCTDWSAAGPRAYVLVAPQLELGLTDHPKEGKMFSTVLRYRLYFKHLLE